MCSTFLAINGVLSACPPMLHRAEVFPLWTLTLVTNWSLASSPHTDPYQRYSSGTGLKSYREKCYSLLQGGVQQNPSHIIYMMNMFKKLKF